MNAISKRKSFCCWTVGHSLRLSLLSWSNRGEGRRFPKKKDERQKIKYLVYLVNSIITKTNKTKPKNKQNDPSFLSFLTWNLRNLVSTFTIEDQIGKILLLLGPKEKPLSLGTHQHGNNPTQARTIWRWNYYVLKIQSTFYNTYTQRWTYRTVLLVQQYN